MAQQHIFALTIISCLEVARGLVIPTEPFNYSTEVDTNGNYLLFWKYNDTHITFEIHVKTYGYVGFGLSENGNMYPADVVVAWVKDGVTHFKDYHTTANAPPVHDKHQDWFLLHGEENNFGTVLKFVRKLDTCDKTEDKKIEFLIPAATTTYNCRVFRMPNIGGKHHLIKVEPIITPGNEMHVHHILVYRCRGIDPKFHDVRYLCYDEIPKGLDPCYDVITGWAIGGKTFYYPEHVGFSVGAPDDPDFYIMETHYDNPAQKSGMIDNSGIRITLTNKLRPYEADMMEIGHDVNWRHIIPPFEKAYLSQSYCPFQCIDHTLGNMTEIRVFAIAQHSHLLGRAIKTRHFRNGSELSPLATDPHYDFNFQETRLLREEIPIRRGDSFIIECVYDSSERTAATLGGLSTRNEMCLSFLHYYPKVALKQCLSSPTYDSISSLWPRLSTYNWTTQHNRDLFKQKLRESSIYHFCTGDSMVPQTLKYTFRENPPAHDYIPSTFMCP